MDWLKTILENAAINEGALDVSGVLQSVKTELPKHFVPKADYNSKVEELKTANNTITTIKKENKGNETLQNTISAHESTIANLQKENADMKKTYALKDVLTGVGCSDPDYLIYKHGGLDKFTFDKDGKPVGAEQIAETYKQSIPQIFPTGGKRQDYNPPGGSGDPGAVNPFAKEHWNLTEQGRMLRDNPEQARAMAKAAGVTI